jgi:hypothetical protein
VLRAIASVGTSDADPSAAPQPRQNRLRSGISAEQDGHQAIETHSITGGMPVVAFWTLQSPYHRASGNDPNAATLIPLEVSPTPKRSGCGKFLQTVAWASSSRERHTIRER